MPCYCEVCGKRVENDRDCRKAFVEGVELMLCPECYIKVVVRGRRANVFTKHLKQPVLQEAVKREPKRGIARRVIEEDYEVVPDYAKRVKEAREKFGWSIKALAEKVRESESVIKRIESGKLVPSISLAQRLERVLKITLLQPIVDELKPAGYSEGGDNYFTIGDLIKVKDKK
ncbi:MAG: multiprotein bridging factor aMBF1 [Sulfolobales archaeon]|nr:multiprotein bridging factor aMBF1 [Sulfolobales archaeon]MCX8198944.1 multiprotein bridging factor aMBF1 [Sulfolobales archaeon]MDW8169922.1 multiprotein bridging factor aMBF1 [Desulfurococcaceae archaeon]